MVKTIKYLFSKRKNQRFVVKIAIFIFIIVTLSVNFVLAYRNQSLRKELETTKHSFKQINPNVLKHKEKLASKKWVSPSGEKYISYEYSKTFDEYQLHLFAGEEEKNIGRQNEPLNNLKVTWSPDEKYVVVSSTDDLTRIFCVNQKDSKCDGELVFYLIGGASIFWSNQQNAYLSYYRHKGNNIISKLTFSVNSIYPEEKILYKEPWDSLNAYRPVSISPEGKYLVLEQSYEGPATLAIMNTLNHEITQPRKNNELYVVGPNPDYKWNENTLIFKGGVTEDGSWIHLTNENHEFDDNLLKEISLNIPKLN